VVTETADDPPGPGPPGWDVGTGFTTTRLLEIHQRLGALEQPDSPFPHEPDRELTRRRVRWARPVLIGEVTYRTWTAAGRLRHPVWKGLRGEIDPAQVTVAAPAPPPR